MTPLYRILEYNTTFENFKSRERDKCHFICVPNKHGGAGLANVQGEPDGAAIYGIYQWILQLVSRQSRPRQGWLTADGKEDGRRYCAPELARLFRRPLGEVERCLQVCSSPEVGWMQLVEGVAERIPAGYQADADEIDDGCATDARRVDDGCAADARRVDDGCAPDAERMRERMLKEGKNERNSLSKHSETADEPKIPDGCAPDARRVDDGCAPDAEPILHAEAKRLFGALSLECFETELRETQWPNDVEHWLHEALPMKRADFELLHWFYHLPAEHEAFTMTFRRQSFGALIQNLGREVEKIRSVRKRLGLNGLNGSEATQPGWTEKKRAAFEKLFPGSDPGPFHLLDRELREKIEATAETT
jgi:hypothetical protein